MDLRSFRILEVRLLTQEERNLLRPAGLEPQLNQALLTLECGHHVLRVNPAYSGASKATCRLPHP